MWIEYIEDYIIFVCSLMLDLWAAIKENFSITLSKYDNKQNDEYRGFLLKILEPSRVECFAT